MSNFKFRLYQASDGGLIMVKSNNHAGLYTDLSYRYPAPLWFRMVIGSAGV